MCVRTTKTCVDELINRRRKKNGHTVGKPHRGGGVRDRTIASAQAHSRRPRGPLQTHQIHQTRDPNHVSRIQNGEFIHVPIFSDKLIPLNYSHANAVFPHMSLGYCNLFAEIWIWRAAACKEELLFKFRVITWGDWHFRPALSRNWVLEVWVY